MLTSPLQGQPSCASEGRGMGRVVEFTARRSAFGVVQSAKPIIRPALSAGASEALLVDFSK